MIQSREEKPSGLHRRYNVTKADGTPCDPNAVYFVLRLDGGGDDLGHIDACRAAAKEYARQAINAPAGFAHLRHIGLDLLELVHRIETDELEKQRLYDEADCPHSV